MKKSFKIASIVFFVLALLFLIMGIYEIAQSYRYVTTYSSQTANTATTVFQYVITSSMAYFGFGFVFLGIGAIIYKQDKILSAQSVPAEEIEPEVKVAPESEPETMHDAETVPPAEDAPVTADAALEIEPEPEAVPESEPEVKMTPEMDTAAETAPPAEDAPTATDATLEMEPAEDAPARITSDLIKGIFEDK